MKITEKLQDGGKEGAFGYSFEFFPPKTEQGLQNLHDRIGRMAQMEPTFVSFTWGAGGSTSETTMELAAAAQSIWGLETLMHLTCTNMDKERIDEALRDAKAAGIQNILALRGDPPRGQEYWSPCDTGFCHAIDLVKYIRNEYGDYFCIAVAGYPDGHPDFGRYENETADDRSELIHLKEKVDAGADFIITQLFYDVDQFMAWERQCREMGITVPILPGIMPIHSYQGFRRVCNLCRTKLPSALINELEARRHDDQKVKEYGIEFITRMISDLHKVHGYKQFHFSTLNLEKSVRLILAQLGVLPESEHQPARLNGTKTAILSATKDAPVSQLARVAIEKSLGRSETWDEFPNGRWGDSRSPAFGDTTYGVHMPVSPAEALRLWSTPTSESDITQLFIAYITGKLPLLPWCDEALQTETQAITDQLVEINRKGYWTVGSQPAVNGLKSDDPVFGWGPQGGYVYQKAFLEFFVMPDALPDLMERILSNPFVTYFAANRKGEFLTNMRDESHNAVTWGVFPGQEIVQPTIIERKSFETWQQEAFQLWTEWEQLQPPNSPSQQVLRHIGDHCWLLNVVHNDFQNADGIFSVVC